MTNSAATTTAIAQTGESSPVAADLAVDLAVDLDAIEAELGSVSELPVSAHPAVFARIHESLVAALRTTSDATAGPTASTTDTSDEDQG